MTQSGCILQGPSLRLCKSQSLRLKILEKFVLQNSSTRKSKRAEAKRVKARKRIIVLAASVRRIWVFDSFIANSYSNNPFTLWTRNCRPARAVRSRLSLWHRLYAVSCFSVVSRFSSSSWKNSVTKWASLDHIDEGKNQSSKSRQPVHRSHQVNRMPF